MRRRLALCLVGCLAALAPVTGAFGDASNKQPDFEGTSESEGGIQLLGDVGLPTEEPIEILEIGSSETDSSTVKDDPSASNAEATPIGVLGVAPVQAECTSEGTEDGGAVRDSDSAELATVPIEGVATVTLLPAECDTKAVKTNNAQSTASTSVVEASALPDEETGEPQVTADVLTSSSDSKTTSGQANSGSEFSVLEASVGDDDVSLVTCGSDSFQNNGQDTTQTTESSTLVGEIGAPVMLCSSDAVYAKTTPPTQ